MKKRQNAGNLNKTNTSTHLPLNYTYDPFSGFISILLCFIQSLVHVKDLGSCHTYITRELGDFSSVLKLRRLAEIDAVTFGVLQVLLVLHLLDNIWTISAAALQHF